MIFQLSKYMWGLEVLSLVGTFWAFVRGNGLELPASIFLNLLLGYAAYKMTNQYRCTNTACGALLVSAHGSSSSSGGATHVARCPFCGAQLV
jgi:hypothetical protein